MVDPEAFVNFIIAFQSGDFSFVPNTSTITVNTGGVYRVDYSVTLRPIDETINAAFAVTIGGVEYPLSFFGIHAEEIGDTERKELDGFFIANIPAGSAVRLRNKASTVQNLAGTGIDNQAVNCSAISLIRIA